MTLPELSLRRPVFATVLSLLIVLAGVAALARLPVRELPRIETAEVTIRVAYAGAAPEVVDAQITTRVEGAVAGIAGLRSMVSEAERGASRSVLTFDPSRDIDAAANDVRAAIDGILANLPEDADPPEVEKNDSESDPVVQLSLASDTMSALEISDYADRFVRDRLARLPGVANATIYGERAPATRIWLDGPRMAAHGITVADIVATLRANNVELPAGDIETPGRQLQVLADTRFATPEEFAGLVLEAGGARPVTLGDVAEVARGAERTESIFRADLRPAVGIGIQAQAGANTVAISDAVRAEVAALTPQLPPGLTLKVTRDEAVFIEATLRELVKVFAEAVALVTLVIYLFLGSARAALVPVVTIPISVLGALAAMLALGFSLNLLTLFALILAIGLVVDDAIVVLENIQRRLALGEDRATACREGANQVTFAVIATTAVLVAVFLPVSFMEGEIGLLFREFGVVLAVAVAVSGFVALSLSPVLAARLLPPVHAPGRLERLVNTGLSGLERGYRALLARMLDHPLPVLALAAFLGGGALAFSEALPRELTPAEDRGQVTILVTAPQGANLAFAEAVTREVEARIEPLRADGTIASTTTIVGRFGELRRAQLMLRLAPWEARDRPQAAVIAELRRLLAPIGAAQVSVRPMGGLVGGWGGGRLRVMVGGPDIASAAAWAGQLAERLRGWPGLAGVETGYAANQPGMVISVDRARARDLGLDSQAVAETLQTLFAARQVGEYTDQGRRYPVILQARPLDRDDPEDALAILTRTPAGDLIPLSAFARLAPEASSPSLNRYDRVPSVEISGDLTEGTDLAEAIAHVERAAAELPPGATLAFAGQARDFIEARGGVAAVFAMAVVVVFLVLAAQFESFATPMVILVTVPLGLGGAFVALWLAGQSLNIYGQVGLVLLVGLLAKNGILMVEFANQLRAEGRSLRAATLEGAGTRLRPILMTTIATVLGALPLALASGAGAESRVAIGVVICGGLGFATTLTLFLTPVVYEQVARLTTRPAAAGKTPVSQS